MYKQRTHSKETISMIELRVYHSKTRRTESLLEIRHEHEAHSCRIQQHEQHIKR